VVAIALALEVGTTTIVTIILSVNNCRSSRDDNNHVAAVQVDIDLNTVGVVLAVVAVAETTSITTT
jgi:hypothetical protein